jgi:hypothetical protein
VFPKFVTLQQIIGRSVTFRDFSITLIIDSDENLNYEVQETETTNSVCDIVVLNVSNKILFVFLC